MGSVKDLEIIKMPNESEAGIGRFIFSDRYSVFDWGEMPDHIEDKGKAICIVTSYFFELAEKNGIKTHYIGIVESGKPKNLKDLSSPSQIMEFKMARVIKPAFDGQRYDYSIFKDLKGNFLIPLEVIYRNSITEGSSLLKRFKNKEVSPSDFGLSEIPEPNKPLEKPILDFSTKLEVTDRYLKEEEAREISGLTSREFEILKETALKLNSIITQKVRELGLNNEDGKFEFALDEKRELMVVDAIGALDECRFTMNGIHLSKEIMRIFYRKTRWYEEVEKAKAVDRFNWKNLVSPPPPLPDEWKVAISNLYRSYANEITEKQFFDSPPLKEVVKTVEKLISAL